MKARGEVPSIFLFSRYHLPRSSVKTPEATCMSNHSRRASGNRSFKSIHSQASQQDETPRGARTHIPQYVSIYPPTQSIHLSIPLEESSVCLEMEWYETRYIVLSLNAQGHYSPSQRKKLLAPPDQKPASGTICHDLCLFMKGT